MSRPRWPDSIHSPSEIPGTVQSPAAPYIIPATLARGGESIPEAGCSSDVNPPCQFQEYPGTVGWKSGYRFYRDQPLNYASEQACIAAGAACERRFDRNRKDIFHYALFAHAIGLPRSTDPASPLNHVPANTSGIADLVGGDMLVTLGFWDNLNGSDYMQAATVMHELGHNLGLRHGGVPFEFNCKPNYQSVMNYLFQARGLVNASGLPVLDYSRQALPALDPNRASETAPFASPVTLPYYTRWYAPIASSFLDMTLRTTPATKHCNGSPLSEAEGWVRVDGTTLQAPFDWNANGTLDIAAYSQDLSFNGVRRNGDLPVLNAGVNDWALVDLRQVGGRRNVGSRRINGSLSLDIGFGDVGFGDVGFGDVGFGDVGFGDVGAPAGNLDLDTAAALGNAPNALTATVARRTVNLSWQKPYVGNVNDYIAYRVTGAGITRATLSTLVTIASPQSPTTTAVDTSTRNNTTYTYFVAARFFDGTQSGISNPVTVVVK